MTDSALIQYPLEVDGIVTRVLEVGTGDDVIVCLHGSGSRADRWRPAMHLLGAAGRHCYAIDYPGHGLASKPAGYTYTAKAFAEFAAGFVRSLDHPTLHLAGTSIGGYVAGLIALDAPEQIRSLCLIGAVGLTPNAGPVATASGNVSRVDRDAIRAKLQFLVEDDTLVVDSWVEEEWRINSSPGAAEAMAALQADNSSPREPIGDQIAALNLPTMLCWGAQDRWVPASLGIDALAVLPAAPLVLMQGAGHAPYFERPADFVKSYLSFLNDPTSLAAGATTI